MDLRKKAKKKGFTLIELMVVIVIIGILVAIALPNFIAAQDRAKLSSVKANMHTVQTIGETYAVDWGGVYPGTLTAMNNEAGSGNYWKDFKNPFSAKSGAGASYLGAALTAEGDMTSGIVAWQPITTSDGSVTQYFIYGGDKADDTFIKDKGAAFFLTNQ